MKWFGLLSVILLMLAVLLFASPSAHADEPSVGESNVVMDICVAGATQVHVTASDGSRIDVGAQGAVDAHMRFAAAADTVFDIYIIGDGEADIDVSGPCEVNVKVEGPAKVNIKAGDEVKLNVEASDESQVFVDDQSPDNPAQKPDEPAGYQETGHNDPPVTYQESADVDDHASRLNSYLATLGAFPAAGLLAFFLIRRRAKNNKNKGETE